MAFKMKSPPFKKTDIQIVDFADQTVTNVGKGKKAVEYAKQIARQNQEIAARQEESLNEALSTKFNVKNIDQVWNDYSNLNQGFKQKYGFTKNDLENARAKHLSLGQKSIIATGKEAEGLKESMGLISAGEEHKGASKMSKRTEAGIEGEYDESGKIIDKALTRPETYERSIGEGYTSTAKVTGEPGSYRTQGSATISGNKPVMEALNLLAENKGDIGIIPEKYISREGQKTTVPSTAIGQKGISKAFGPEFKAINKPIVESATLKKSTFYKKPAGFKMKRGSKPNFKNLGSY
jgi:hypothetical protein